MSQTQLIILNGASSSGKTVLCKQLQAILDEPYIHLEEDCFVYNTYHDSFLTGELAPQIFRKTMLGYYRSLKAFLSAGHNILADTGFYTSDLLQVCVQELAAERVWLIGVQCSLVELERRECERGDRPSGLAKEQHQSIHAGVIYDIEVDTSTASPEECALVIKAKLRQAVGPRALARLWQQFRPSG